MLVNSANVTALIKSLGAQAIGVFGQLFFGLSVLYSSNQAQAELTLKVVIYASIFATCARLGIDNFFISKYRNKTKRASSIAMVYLIFISCMMAVLILAAANVVLNTIKVDLFGASTLLLAIFMSLNALSSNYLALRNKPHIAILLRGNIVFIPGAIMTIFDLQSDLIVSTCIIAILVSFISIVNYFNIALDLPSFSLLIRNFRRWVKIYFSLGHQGVLYGIFAAVWGNWLYLMATFGGISIDEALANLMQRILNGCKTLAFMFFLIDPFCLPKKILDIALAFFLILSFIFILLDKVHLNNLTASIILGIFLSLFEFGRVAIIEARQYTVLSCQLLIIMLTTIFISGDTNDLVLALSVGIFLSLIFERLILKR